MITLKVYIINYFKFHYMTNTVKYLTYKNLHKLIRLLRQSYILSCG